jgi:hypothetical protein
MIDKDPFDDWLKAQADQIPVPDHKPFWTHTAASLKIGNGLSHFWWLIPATIISVGVVTWQLATSGANANQESYTPRAFAEVPDPTKFINQVEAPTDWYELLELNLDSGQSNTSSPMHVAHPKDAQIQSKTDNYPLMSQKNERETLASLNSENSDLEQTTLAFQQNTDKSQNKQDDAFASKQALQITGDANQKQPSDNKPFQQTKEAAMAVPTEIETSAIENRDSKEQGTASEDATDAKTIAANNIALSEADLNKAAPEEPPISETQAEDIGEVVQVMKQLAKKPRWGTYFSGGGTIGVQGDSPFQGLWAGLGIRYQLSTDWHIAFGGELAWLLNLNEQVQWTEIQYGFDRIELEKNLQIFQVFLLQTPLRVQRQVGRHTYGVGMVSFLTLDARGLLDQSAMQEIKSASWGYRDALPTIWIAPEISYGFRWASHWQFDIMVQARGAQINGRNNRMIWIQTGIKKWL